VPVRASVFIATSLDGFIAREDGGIDWLAGDEQAGEDYGYQAFIDTVDALVMGRATFEQALTFDPWPYAGKRVVVLSSRPLAIPERLAGGVEHLDAPPAAVVERLGAQGAGHLYVDGGQTIQRFVRAGLIDELVITRTPVLIGKGLPLFGPLERDVRLAHVETRAYPSGYVQSRYRVER
jgi:dihydrofolate reductase